MTIILVLQLFFADHPRMHVEVPVSSLEECWELAHDFVKIKEYQGKPINAVAAGCYVPHPQEDPT